MPPGPLSGRRAGRARSLSSDAETGGRHRCQCHGWQIILLLRCVVGTSWRFLPTTQGWRSVFGLRLVRLPSGQTAGSLQPPPHHRRPHRKDSVCYGLWIVIKNSQSTYLLDVCASACIILLLRLGQSDETDEGNCRYRACGRIVINDK